MIFWRALRRVGVAFVLLLAIAGALGAIYFDHLFPFDLAREPGFTTKFHLSRLKDDPARCMAALDRADVNYVRVPPLEREEGCGYADAVRLQNSSVNYGGGVSLRCPAMLALLLWERHVLLPAAQRHFDQKPASIHHLGTYACRPIAGRSGRRLSQHAFANAIDIASVTLGGETVSVLHDWDDAGVKGQFLRELRAGACGIFSAVLSPDYNAAHANHFHFDLGRWSVCR
ncbi:MAG TPA: extensin family protein [Xanthobacteraceae bacterium]|nr:extensin family protein [Xanthobacteraceae bacterium]